MKPSLPARPGSAGPDFFSADVAKARRFYLDLDPPRERRLAVVCGGVEHCTAGYAIRRATFPFYSLEFVARGRGEVTLKGRRFPLQPGALFSYGPGVAHHITGSPVEPLVKYFVDFAGTDAARLLRSCGLPAGRWLRVHPPHAPQPLLDELLQAGLSPRRETAALCAKLLECLALRIAAARVPPGGAEALAFGTYQHCRQHIEQHGLRLRTLKEIAAECHINNAYLCRLFRRFDHQSPYQYLLRLKMTQAAARLQEPGSLVKQVGRDVGFPDPFHFSRIFKTVLGLSPDAFRRMR